MSAEQMSWLAQDVAAVPGGHTKLAFFHYDFGGTLGNGLPAANFTQFNNPAALGLDGVFWGHNHGVADATPAQRAAHPFNLGLQSVIYNSSAGGRSFRIYRVSGGGSAVSPGVMHHSGGNSPPASVDSLTITWSDVNDGTRTRLTATVVNRYGEAWEHARLRFVMVDHDSVYTSSAGTVAQVIQEGGRANVYVDCVLNAGATTVVTVTPTGPTAVGAPPVAARALGVRAASPWRIGEPLALHYSLAGRGALRLALLDPQGRRIATIASGTEDAGDHDLAWTPPAALTPGVYFVRLETRAGTRSDKVTLTP
jgi:hypothetical protein